MKAAIIYKISIWEIYNESPDEETQAYLDRGGHNLEILKRSSGIQREALQHTCDALDAAGIAHEQIYRGELTPEDIADKDIIISVGGDGTFLDASHLVPPHIPMLGVNSDPERSVGFFSATDGSRVHDYIAHLADQPRTGITRLQATIEGLPAGPPILNDVLFAHPNPAATTRYRMISPHPNPQGERPFRNSGLLVCSAAGSSGWMFQEQGELMLLDDHRMQFLHRGVRNARPTLSDAPRIEIESLTRRGLVFIDGEHTQINLTLGQKLTIEPGPPLNVIGDLNAKRK